uniref:Group 1 glycosyl transferase n=1 Tax=uncultured bacterium F39-01 TaxID=1191434 RepID=I3VID9_9BACT|nr:group 1 glycosyl transferase [uncultured bacterium F39-01]
MKILLLNQCFFPDVVSTAQHLTDLALELTERGHSVTVLTSDRGYDDAAVRFPRREEWKGIRIIRIPSLSFGKATKLRRALNFSSFLANCSLRLLFLSRFDVVIALTSPPLISFLAALFVRLKGGKFCFWVMDLNPDEAIAAGWLRKESITARLLQWMLNYSLKHASQTIALDRFMRERILAKGAAPALVSVVPPWSHDDKVTFNEEGRLAFRERHGLSDKFVVMYSGNHSPCHPLNTLLDAALNLSSDSSIAFCFVGGGSEQTKVREFASRHRLNSISVLPYQPLSELSSSLSAADLHVVVMGDQFVGVVHPCKIYNIMAIGSPTLYIGPEPSHITDIAQTEQLSNCLLTRHGDADGVVAAIREAFARARVSSESLVSNQQSTNFSRPTLLPQMLRLIESNKFEASAVPEVVAPSQF